MRFFLIFFIAVGTAFLACRAHAFPQMIKHGYVHCTSCHVSPAGGGLLTEYGRELSKEVLSTWGEEGESRFAYGLVKPPEWLNLGGEFRGLLLYQDTPQFRELRTILMQADLETEVRLGALSVVGTFGVQEAPSPSTLSDHFLSRRHFLLYSWGESFKFRGGKFQTVYGIQTPEHTIATKRALGWDEGHETYNVEAAYLGESAGVFVTGVLGRPDKPELAEDGGVASKLAVPLYERHQVGLSYFLGKNAKHVRNIFGPYGILSFTKSLTLLTEADFLRVHGIASGPGAKITEKDHGGFVNHNKLAYEWVQGFHTFFMFEVDQHDNNKRNLFSKGYGGGIEFFPRPHWELNLSYQYTDRVGTSSGIHWLYGLLHFYL